MPSSYYEQGRRDAEAGEINQLFYHTYHDYKRGYDDALRGPPGRPWGKILGAILLLIGLGAGLGWLLRDRGVLGAQSQPTVIVVTSTPVVPTPTFPFAIATAGPAPSATPGAGQPGRAARVNTDGGTLRLRSAPSTESEQLGSLQNGTTLTVVGGPVEAEGYVWWEIESASGRGWVVGTFLQLEP